MTRVAHTDALLAGQRHIHARADQRGGDRAIRRHFDAPAAARRQHFECARRHGSRRRRTTRAETLVVQTAGQRMPLGQRHGIGQHRVRTAQIDVLVRVQAGEQPAQVQPAGCRIVVEVVAHTMPAGAGVEPVQERAAARAVVHLEIQVPPRQVLRHGDDGRDADAARDQHHAPMLGRQGEQIARAAHPQGRPDGKRLAQIMRAAMRGRAVDGQLIPLPRVGRIA